MTSFPDVRWGSKKSRLRRPAIAIASTKPGSWTIRQLTPLDRRLMLRSRGRLTVLGPIGAPTMLLTTSGRTSGLRRTTPLLYGRRAADSLIVVGSNFGQEHHPAWTSNLLADPHVVVTIGGKEVPAIARPLDGDEAAAGYAELATLVRTYSVYQDRTDRAIRVFELRPVGAVSG